MSDQQNRDAFKAMCVAMAIFALASYAGTAIIMHYEKSESPFWRFMWSDGNAVIKDVTAMLIPLPGKNGGTAHADERR